MKKHIIFALLLAFGLTASAQTLATATISTAGASAPVPANFLGLSIEWCSAQTVMGQASTGGADPIFKQLVGNLTAYGSGPMFFRIGGNSVDSGGTCSTPTGIQSVQAFNEFYAATGTTFSLSVNLNAENLAASEAQATAYCAGMPANSIAAFEIGNEPDIYSGWTGQRFATDFSQWITGLKSVQNCTKNIMGPSFANTAGHGAFATNQSAFYVAGAVQGLTIATSHYYTGDNTKTSGWLMTTGNTAVNYGPTAVLWWMQAAHALGMQFRLNEMNSNYSGGAPGVSNAFESALWFIPQALNYAYDGLDGINVHGGYTASGGYTPFSVTSASGHAPYSLGANEVFPIYYGMLFFEKALNGANATIWPVTLSLSPSTAQVQAWSTIDHNGVQRLIVVNRDATNSGNIVVANSASTASACYLTAPSYSSTNGVKIFANFAGSAGQNFDASTDGTPTGTIGWDVITPSGGNFTVPIGTAQAMILTFGSSTGC